MSAPFYFQALDTCSSLPIHSITTKQHQNEKKYNLLLQNSGGSSLRNSVNPSQVDKDHNIYQVREWNQRRKRRAALRGGLTKKRTSFEVGLQDVGCGLLVRL